MTTTDTAAEISARIEAMLLSNIENINPNPVTLAEATNLVEFMEDASEYANIIQPSETFVRRMNAFLEDIYTPHTPQVQQPRPHVQVTRVGSKRVFGNDITNQVQQRDNIAANRVVNRM